MGESSSRTGEKLLVQIRQMTPHVNDLTFDSNINDEFGRLAL